jgi:hypothetical protein
MDALGGEDVPTDQLDQRGRWTDKEILRDLNFRWAEFVADPIPLLPGQDVAALYDDLLTVLAGTITAGQRIAYVITSSATVR